MYTRDRVINEIINLVDVLNIKEIEGWDDIPFSSIKNLRYMKKFSLEELSVLLEILVDMSSKNTFIPFEKNKIKIENLKVTSMKTEVSSLKDKSRKEVIEQIINLVYEIGLYNYREILVDWDDILFSEIESLRDECNVPNKELSILLKYLKKLKKQVTMPLTEKWHADIPIYIKLSFENWHKFSMETLEEEVQHILSLTNSSNRKDELEDFLGVLEDLRLEDESESFDPLGVLEKYNEGSRRTSKTIDTPEVDNSWRNTIPSVLKRHIENWKTESLEVFYFKARDLIEVDRKVIIPFVAELSHLVFDEEATTEEGVDELEFDTTDSIADGIMSLVEMIIGPHLEVMDIIQQRGGNIKFSNLWHKPFTEQLKQTVKDRDGWRCVICEGETDLHVHHKIPRDKGGIHHPDNLVTLCASCHGVIETADIKKAFEKCLINYKKNKFNQLKPKDLSMDKRLLQEEVESSLDQILLQLNQKDEHKLMEEVIGVIQRLEVLFYE
jgi:hypothetical protein